MDDLFFRAAAWGYFLFALGIRRPVFGPVAGWLPSHQCPDRSPQARAATGKAKDKNRKGQHSISLPPSVFRCVCRYIDMYSVQHVPKWREGARAVWEWETFECIPWTLTALLHHLVLVDVKR